MGFLMAALMCFNLLAWPLFSLGFPLYASVRAIETNSIQEMRALVAYWILFSLISIFELAFGKLIQWLPFWPYIRLISICWMVLPRFNGACYVYEHLIHQWLSINPQELVKLIVRPKKSTSLDAERLLSMAEKFVKENGREALEKLIAGKPEHRNPDGDMEEIKAVTNTEEKGTAAAMLKAPNAVKGNAKAVELTAKNSDAATDRSPPKVPNVAKENAKAVELKEKDLAATERSQPKGPDVAKENAKAGEVMKKDLAAIEKDRPKELDMAKENAKAGEEKEKHPVATERVTTDVTFGSILYPVATERVTTDVTFGSILYPVATERVKYVEPNLAQTEKKTVASREIKEKTTLAEKQVMEELASSEKVQREWTCAVCQFTTSSEQNLSSHLRGMKHKAKCEEVEASKNKRGSSSTSGWEHKKANSRDNPSPSKPKQNIHELWCGICNVSCTSQIDLESHLRGRRHLLQFQETLGTWGGWD
ncbi:HVA22-like protein h [Diospyros lotus]|uniref:HVA22-like protein h n=1 Tax=Diospyros lotus TaxID=55363 RepID=UPI00224D637B|nr:HVA22-like protein h [Diospyros lotus]